MQALFGEYILIIQCESLAIEHLFNIRLELRRACYKFLHNCYELLQISIIIVYLDQGRHSERNSTGQACREAGAGCGAALDGHNCRLKFIIFVQSYSILAFYIILCVHNFYDMLLHVITFQSSFIHLK